MSASKIPTCKMSTVESPSSKKCTDETSKMSIGKMSTFKMHEAEMALS